MKKTLKTTLSLVLVFMLLFGTISSAFAASGDVLEFTVSPDGYAVVSDCDALAQGVVTVPAKVTIAGKTYNVRYIGEKAFDSCYSITEIVIPEGVTAIRDYAFRDCLSLTELHIPQSLAICQYDAFEGCGTITVHCYRSNYQFFTVYGMSANLRIDILDADEGATEPEEEAEPDFITKFINALRAMIAKILELFGAGEEDDFDLPFGDFLDKLPSFDNSDSQEIR